MSEEKSKPDKAPKVKKPLEYRRFEEVLNKVIKAPPMRPTEKKKSN
jgi:hypothetical protein